MKSTRLIPHGPYCYSVKSVGQKSGHLKQGLCLYWSRRGDKPEQENGYCAFLGSGDWDSEGISLLWDQVKECGINTDAMLDDDQSCVANE